MLHGNVKDSVACVTAPLMFKLPFLVRANNAFFFLILGENPILSEVGNKSFTGKMQHVIRLACQMTQ